MKYRIKRTSIYDDEKPCEEAIIGKYTRIDERSCKSFEEFDNSFGGFAGGNWLSQGINHCINKRGNIQREFKDSEEGWFIDINTLEELQKLVEKYGDLIIGQCWQDHNIYEIEIYDDYRE